MRHIALRVISRDWPGSHTRGITSTAYWGSRRKQRGWCWRAPCNRSWRTVSPCWGFAPRNGCDSRVSLLVVGSIALDSVITPFGETADTLGGAAVFFAMAGAILHPVQVVGVVGSDFPEAHLKKLAERGV